MSKKNKGGKKGNNKPIAKNVQQPAPKAAEKKVDKKSEEKPEEKKAPEVPPTPDKANDGVQTVENGGVSVEKPGEKKQEQKQEKKHENAPIIDDEHVKGLQYALAHGTTSSLDANHRVELLGLLRKTFVDEQRPEFVAPVSVQVHMNKVLQIGVVCELAQSAIDSDSAFGIVLRKSDYPGLVETAKDLGITLPSIKLLEANTSAAQKKQGNITVPGGKGSGIKVSAEAKKQLEKQKEIQNNPPELDPLKITSEEDLKKALEYLLSRKNTFGKNLVDVVDFMRNYRMNEASHAENSTAAMEKLDSRTTTAWLDDAFQYVDTNLILTGLSNGMVATLDLTGAPVRAFTLLRESIKDKDGKYAWDDQSIADAVVAIIKWRAQYMIKKNEENTASLGDPSKYDDTAKTVAKANAESTQKIKNYLQILLDPPTDFMTNFADKLHAKDKQHVTLAGVIRLMYYPETLTDENKNKTYKNLEDNIIQRIGIIFNLFRTAGDKIETYSEDNLTEPVAYTDDELKAQKKAEGEAKKAEKEAKAAKK